MANYDMKKAQANARRVGVTVKPSTRKGKKLDVFDKSGKKVASIGAAEYEDFTKHRDEKRRRAYKSRHAKTRVKRGSPSFYADKILWD